MGSKVYFCPLQKRLSCVFHPAVSCTSARMRTSSAKKGRINESVQQQEGGGENGGGEKMGGG